LYISNYKLPGGLGSTHTVTAILDSELNTVCLYRPGGDDDDDDDDDDDNNNNKEQIKKYVCKICV
jgi:hypothetical protein